MELRQLRYLLVLAEHRQFGRAAERLHLTQQALSMAMTALERSTACELLIRGRGRRSVELTEAGAALVAHARGIVGHADRVLARLSADPAPQPTGAGGLVVGLVAGGAAELTTPILRRFHDDHPDVPVTLRSVDPHLAAAALQAGSVDVLLGPRVITDARHVVLFRDRAVAAVPARHPLARHTDLAAAELGDHVSFTGRPAHDAQTAPTAVVPPGGLDAALTVVGAGLLTAVLAAGTARHHPRPDVAYRPLRDPWWVEIAVTVVPGRRRDGHADAFAVGAESTAERSRPSPGSDSRAVPSGPPVRPGAATDAATALAG